MGCKIHSLKPSILFQVLARTPSFRTKTVAFSSYAPNKGEAVSTSLPKIDAAYSVSFKTLGACKLGISRYPDFEYNAEGGTKLGISRYPDFEYNTEGGTGTGTASKVLNGNELSVSFDIETLYIRD